MLESLLLPGHVRLRAQLDEVLDMELIQQQVAHGALDLLRLAAYVINTMASLCAPVRDRAVRALRDLRDPVELLRSGTKLAPDQTSSALLHYFIRSEIR